LEAEMSPVAGPGGSGFDVVLKHGVDAARAARRALAASDPNLPREVHDDVALLVTELVSNAVRHGDGENDQPLHLAFHRWDGRVRVELFHPGSEFEQPPSRPTNGTAAGGWGLFLVDRIAERWGVRPDASGTCVWFEMPAAVPP
jgi:anti-sigma regulatory factor (Ser/Thr protein kinase)